MHRPLVGVGVKQTGGGPSVPTQLINCPGGAMPLISVTCPSIPRSTRRGAEAESNAPMSNDAPVTTTPVTSKHTAPRLIELPGCTVPRSLQT